MEGEARKAEQEDLNASQRSYWLHMILHTPRGRVKTRLTGEKSQSFHHPPALDINSVEYNQVLIPQHLPIPVKCCEVYSLKDKAPVLSF